MSSKVKGRVKKITVDDTGLISSDRLAPLHASKKKEILVSVFATAALTGPLYKTGFKAQDWTGHILRPVSGGSDIFQFHPAS